MEAILNAAKEIQDFCIQQKWDFCFIGGLAVIRWGMQRTTSDADLTLYTGFGNEEEYIQTLLDHFEPRVPDMMEFALKNRVVLLQNHGKFLYDISLGGFDFEKDIIERASMYSYTDDISLKVCSAEDLVAMKVFAGRHIDWADVRSIVFMQRHSLKWEQIYQVLNPLLELKGDMEAGTQLEMFRKEALKMFGDT